MLLPSPGTLVQFRNTFDQYSSQGFLSLLVQLPNVPYRPCKLSISYYNHEVSILYVSISVGVVHNCRVLLPISNFHILVIDTQTNRTDCSPVCMCVYIV